MFTHPGNANLPIGGLHGAIHENRVPGPIASFAALNLVRNAG